MTIEFKNFRRMGISQMRPYIPGEDMAGISVSDADRVEVFGTLKTHQRGGYIARNPDNHADQWYVSQAWFEKQNFQEVV